METINNDLREAVRIVVIRFRNVLMTCQQQIDAVAGETGKKEVPFLLISKRGIEIRN